MNPIQSHDKQFLRFLWVFTLAGLPAVACLLAARWHWAFILMPILLIHVAIPAIDAVVPADTAQAFERATAPSLATKLKAFDWPVWCLPSWYLAVITTIWLSKDLSGWTWVLAGVSLGATGGILAINAAHELIHRKSVWQRRAGGWLLAGVCYGAFKTEHVRGHHLWVATQRDTASAKRGQLLYTFMAKSIIGTMANAWRLEREKPLLQNEFWQLNALSVVLAITIYLSAGLAGLGMFLIASFVAIIELEIINYIEHYGLNREQDSNGRFIKVTEQHSWNVNTPIANTFLFNLQRHSDHHMNAGREYLALRDMVDAPRLPGGYGAMVLMALIPPLWFKVMDHALDKHAQSQQDQSLANQAKQN